MKKRPKLKEIRQKMDETTKRKPKVNIPLSKLIARRIKYDDKSNTITLGDEVIGSWSDDALCDYPEDLIWSRDISVLFCEAFEAGYNYAIKTRVVK